MSFLRLATKSLVSRLAMVLLLTLAIALSTALVIGIEKLTTASKQSLSHSISATDLIVGSRTGELHLLLYSLFHTGKPVSLLPWDTVEQLHADPHIAWVIPFSLGDSHRGYTVVGTTNAYFKHRRYGRKHPLSFQAGSGFNSAFSVVIGAKVAKSLQYQLGQTLYLSHGTGQITREHASTGFVLTGILAPTGTPIDRSVFTPLAGLDALHRTDLPSSSAPLTLHTAPRHVSGCFVGLHHKRHVFSIQRQLDSQQHPPLTAIIPGVALARFWQQLSIVPQAFFVLGLFVTLFTFLGLLVAFLMALSHRKQELALLRAMGCRPMQLVALLLLESLLITITGIVGGLLLILGVGYSLGPILEKKWGLLLPLHTLTSTDLLITSLILLAGVLIGLFPAISAYRSEHTHGLPGQ